MVDDDSIIMAMYQRQILLPLNLCVVMDLFLQMNERRTIAIWNLESLSLQIFDATSMMKTGKSAGGGVSPSFHP